MEPAAKEATQFVCFFSSSSLPAPHSWWRSRAHRDPPDDQTQFDTGDEYQNLVRYISNYREGRRKSVASISPDADAVKKPWWKFWAKSGKAPGMDQSSFEVPDDWLETDLSQGLRSSELDGRRKYSGWNELTTEKVRLPPQSVMISMLIPLRRICSSNSYHISPALSYTVCGFSCHTWLYRLLTAGTSSHGNCCFARRRPA